MTISAKVILDSIAPNGARLTTFELTYPRFIHVEALRHRVLSRNVSSSRAIPTAKKIERIRQDTARPSEWGINQKGMQAGTELPLEDQKLASAVWDEACNNALTTAEVLCGLRCENCCKMFEPSDGSNACGCGGSAIKLNLHKQVANRILEPFDHVQEVVSTTKLKNHFKLRLALNHCRALDCTYSFSEDGSCSCNCAICNVPMADPTYYELATKWKEAFDASVPKLLNPGEWHLPYIDMEVDVREGIAHMGSPFGARSAELLALLKKVSVGRCARVSYMRQGKGDVEANVELHDRLAASGHWSPFEHVATPIGGFSLIGKGSDNAPNIFACDWCSYRGHDTSVSLQIDAGLQMICMKCAHGHIHSGNYWGWSQYRKEFAEEAGGE